MRNLDVADFLRRSPSAAGAIAVIAPLEMIRMHGNFFLVCAASAALLGHATAAIAQEDLIAPLTLAQALTMAVAHNHDLQLSRLTLESAAAARLSAAASPNPTLTVQSFNINPAVGIGAGPLRDKTIDSTVRIDQLIERGGKRALRMDSAAHLAEAAQGDLYESLRQLRLNVTQAYYDALAADQKFEIAQQTADLYQATVGAAQKRLKAGDIASIEVVRLQIDALRAQNDVVQSAADQLRVRQTLLMLLGPSGAGGVSALALVLASDWTVAPVDDQAPAAALSERRPDVLAAQARLHAAVAAHQLALSLRTRDISIGVQAEHFPASVSNAQGSGNSYGIAVQIPIFARYQYDGEIRTAQTNLAIAQENLDKVRDQARSDLFISWVAARAAFARLQRYDQTLLSLARQSADAAEFGYRHGALGVMDVLDARRTYRATRLEALAAHTDYAKAVAAWQATISERSVQ